MSMTSSYGTDEELRNLLIFGARFQFFKLNKLWFVNFSLWKIRKIQKIYNLEDSKNFRLGKIQKNRISGICSLENSKKKLILKNSKNFEFGKFIKCIIWKIHKVYNLKDSKNFRLGKI